MGWVAWQLERARHDQRVMAEFFPAYDFCGFDMPGWSPERLKTIWVMNHFFSVNRLEFGRLPWLTDDELEHLDRLPRLKKLKIESDAITDEGLKHLVELKGLWVLGIASPQVTDAGLLTLGKMKQLRELAIECPQVTAEGMERLKHDLPDCEMRSFKIMDVVAD